MADIAQQHEIDEPVPRRGRSSRLRNFAIGMLIGSLLSIVVVVTLLALLRDRELPQVTFEQLDAAVERWGANGPANYDLDLELTGINPGTAHIEVRGGEVTAMTLNGHATKSHLWDNWSVPSLLAIIRRDLEVCMAPMKTLAPGGRGQGEGDRSPPSVTPRGLFDSHYGYPTQYHRVTPTGADAKWKITKFEPK